MKKDDAMIEEREARAREWTGMWSTRARAAEERLAAVAGLLAAYGDDVPGGTAELLVHHLRAAIAEPS